MTYTDLTNRFLQNNPQITRMLGNYNIINICLAKSILDEYSEELKLTTNATSDLLCILRFLYSEYCTYEKCEQILSKSSKYLKNYIFA